MERLRLEQLAAEEARKLALERSNAMKARTMLRRVMKGVLYCHLFRWAHAVPAMRRWCLREELMDYLDEVEELRSAKQQQEEAACEVLRVCLSLCEW